MTYRDNLEKASRTLNNPVLLNNFWSQNLNWVHAIRTTIFNFESNNSLFDESTKKNNDNLSYADTSQKRTEFKKYLIGLLKNLLLMIQSFKSLIHLFFFAKNRRRTKIINFSFDNFDIKYGEYYYNPYSDNINIKEKAINLCVPLRGQEEQLKKAYFKPFIIRKSFITHVTFFLRKNHFNINFLNPIEDFLNNAAFNNLKAKIKEIYINYLFFLFVLRLFKPKQIFLYDSYNTFTLGLIAASKKLGIQTIEQQHGIIDPSHFGYCYNYTNLRQTDFICDQLHYYTKLLIDEAKKNWTFHPTLVEITSSPAFQVWQKFKNSSDRSNLLKFKKIISGHKVISFGLTNQLLPDWLIEILEKNNGDYFFCFRLHPRYADFNRSQITKLQQKIPNSDFKISSSIALFDLCELSDYFFSDGSTSLIDALPFNLKCICFSENLAYTVFEPYIKHKLIIPVTNRSEFNKVILNC
jgi:hypothetical protein